MRSLTGLVAGTVGGVAMCLAMAVLRWMGVELHVERYLGAALASGGGTRRITGIAAFVALYALFGALYTLAFRSAFRRADLRSGLTLGLIHGAVALGLAALLPLGSPGGLLARMGVVGSAVFALLHLLYGAIVAAIYRPIATSPDRHLDGLLNAETA